MGTKTQKLSNVVDQIVEWQSVVVADGSTNTTGVSGRGYFIDTSAGAHTINLPASPKIGDVVKVSLITAGNELTIGRNGNNINGNTSNITTSVDGDMFELVYVNVSEGWKTVGQISAGTFISATGGTITQSGNYQIHTFTGDGCFVVSSVGNSESNPLGGPSTVDYLVVAGGGGGGGGAAPSSLSSAGGGAGGYRESSGAASGCYTVSPLGACVSALPVSATTYPVTVGGGGSGGPSGDPAGVAGSDGSNSVFSTITSAGGGGGAARNACINNGRSGGSGGGGVVPNGTGGSGNTPPVSPPQGNSGGGSGCGTGNWSGGGGGGATVAGDPGIGTPGGGGNGATSSINGTPTARAGGGGGGGTTPGMPTLDGGFGGTGGGGNGGPTTGSATAGSTNTGGGGGGAASQNCGTGAAGGKGIVIIRYKFQ